MNRRKDSEENVTVATKVRRVNAVLSIVLVAFFLIHASLGAALSYDIIGSGLAIAAWAGIIVAAAHVIGSIVTTAFMLCDKKRPPSTAKKRHQLLKWITGIAVAVLLLLHLTTDSLMGHLHDVVDIAIAVVLLGALAAHTYTGTKSLTRDLRASSSIRWPFRIGVIALSVIIGAAFISIIL